MMIAYLWAMQKHERSTRHSGLFTVGTWLGCRFERHKQQQQQERKVENIRWGKFIIIKNVQEKLIAIRKYYESDAEK